VECFGGDFVFVEDDELELDAEIWEDCFGVGFSEGVKASGLCCVCILVLTTSRGHVITPAMPPADAPVKISNPIPISLWPTHAFAIFCSCS
jgi:hypothetical protein